MYGMKVCSLLVVAMAWWCRGAGGAATARPLESSPGELAWAAWLRAPSNPEPSPRRITTKSLFVFPHLGADALPACADGYRPDHMGRCVQVVRVDETAHLEFLLQKLNSKFSTQSSGEAEYDYDQEPDPPESAGPLQLSIPLMNNVEVDDGGSGDEISTEKEDAPKPTSSPEYVPEDKIPDDKPSNGTVAIAANGKFENFTCDSCEETTKPETTTEITTEAISDRNNSSATGDRGLVIIPNQNDTDAVEQIEALKRVEKPEKPISLPAPISLDVISDSQGLNIEDKIKVISRFADVVVDDFEKRPPAHVPSPGNPFEDRETPPWWDGPGWKPDWVRPQQPNHRRGKPLVYKHARSDYEEPFVYARDRHPHYRE